jgi:hypothetical protein
VQLAIVMHLCWRFKASCFNRLPELVDMVAHASPPKKVARSTPIRINAALQRMQDAMILPVCLISAVVVS